jgi:hypothetical protein
LANDTLVIRRDQNASFAKKTYWNYRTSMSNQVTNFPLCGSIKDSHLSFGCADDEILAIRRRQDSEDICSGSR